MHKYKISEAKCLEILAKHDAGSRVADLCKEHQISPATLYNWKKSPADDHHENKRRVQQLEQENEQNSCTMKR